MSDPALEPTETAPPPGARTMAIVRWVLIGAMALLAAWAIVYVRGRRAGGSGGGNVQGEATAPDTQQWFCPMHPAVIRNQPGECPICHMQLEPLELAGGAEPQHAEHAVPGLAPITLGPERIQLIGLRTAPVTRRALIAEVRTVGTITARETGLARVDTRFAGWVETLAVAQTGVAVKKGQLLATLNSPDLVSAQQELLTARTWAKSAGAPPSTADLVADARERLVILGLSRADLARVEQTGAPLRSFPVRAPASGHVIAKSVVLGTYVQPGTALFEIADLSTVWLLAEVFEQDLAHVQVGQTARLTLPAWPNQPFTGVVDLLYPALDPATRTMKVRVVLANPELRLLPNMFGDVVLESPAIDGLTVPREAVVDSGDLQYVFVAAARGRFEPRRVTLGARAADQIQILSGVVDGETVVTTANFLIDSESRLRAAITGQTSAGVPSACDALDAARFPDKYQQCRECEIVHRGMGSMVGDCKAMIPQPWK